MKDPGKTPLVPVLGAGCVALAAAGITAKATHDVAVSTQFITDPTFAWLAPLGIEGGSIAFAWMVWDSSSRGESGKLQRLGLAFFLAMSMAANLYHVKDKGNFALLEAIFFPIALVLVVEALFGTKRTKERKRRASPPQATQAKRPAAPAPRPASARPKPSTAPAVQELPVGAATPAPKATIASAQKTGSPHSETVDKLLAENPTITGKVVGEYLGVSDQHGRRLLAAARKRAEEAAA
jgi:hypothetical protein